MPPAGNTPFESRAFVRIGCALLFILAAWTSFSGFYAKWHFREAGVTNWTDASAIDAMLDGAADRPFVYRRMLPDMANGIARLVPATAQDRLYHWAFAPSAFSHWPPMNAIARSPLAADQKWFFRYLVFYCLTLLCACAATYALFLACRAIDLPFAVCVFAPVILILLAPFFMIYAYDYAELVFLALAVWVALRHSPFWLLPLAALGTWNKESFLFFIPTLYPFLRARLSRRASVAAVVALCVICGLVYLDARARFAGNNGVTAVHQVRPHFRQALDPEALFTATEETYGVRLPRVSTLLPTCLLLWVFLRIWKQLPPTVRQHGLIAAAINTPLYFAFCTPGEYRNFSFLAVLFVFAIALNLRDALRISKPPEPA